MNTLRYGLPWLLALAAVTAQAQEPPQASTAQPEPAMAAPPPPPIACPKLPAGSSLSWVHKGSPGADLCRAVQADGNEVFALYISANERKLSGKRAEEGYIDGHEVRWYRGELPNQPQIQVRETQFELDKQRSVYVWLRATSDQQVIERIGLIQGLGFGSLQLSRN